MEHANNWEIKTAEYGEKIDTNSLLSQLAGNQIAAVQISNFFTKEELDIIVANINRQSIFWYPESKHKQGRIGLSAAEFYSKPNGKALYFERTPEYSQMRDNFFSETTNPIQKIIALFSDSHETAIAREPGMNDATYFCGLIRAMGGKSTLHFDYAPHQLRGWEISESTEQFALVVYLQMPVTGGELLIYNRPWTIEDDVYNMDTLQKGPYGFDPIFLKEEIPTKISPIAGDLIIFRTRNFHQIEAINPGLNQYRFTFSSFLSLKDGALFLWS